MMLLDSTFLIDVLRGKRELLEKIRELEKETLCTTETNVFEVLVGVCASKKADKKKDTETALQLFSLFTVFPLDRKGAHTAAAIAGQLLATGKPIGELDCLTAGIALANGVSRIVTDNKAHFERVPGIEIIEMA